MDGGAPRGMTIRAVYCVIPGHHRGVTSAGFPFTKPSQFHTDAEHFASLLSSTLYNFHSGTGSLHKPGQISAWH